MNLDTYSRAQVARFCIEEAAQYGGTSYMLSIAFVLRNRVLAGWGPWIEVARTAAAKRGHVAEPSDVDMRSANIRQFLQRFDDVYSGADEDDLSGGALWYLDSTLPVQDWFKRDVLSDRKEHPMVGQAPPILFFQ